MNLNNMKGLYAYLILVSSILLSSCEKWRVDKDEYPVQYIYLSADVDEGVKSKAPYMQPTPTPDYHLNATVWASTIQDVYINKGWDGTSDVDANGDRVVSENERAVSIHTHAFFQSSEPQLLGQAIYPPPIVTEGGVKTAPPVYFVAMYPRSGDFKDDAGNGLNWTTPSEGEFAGRTASYTFDGRQDVMFASKVSGQYDIEHEGAGGSSIVTEVPDLRFRHLLTLFTVKIEAFRESGVSLYDIQSAWGKVLELRIQQWNTSGWTEDTNTLTIKLSDGSVTYGEPDKQKYTTFYNTGLDTKFPAEDGGFTLIDTPQEVAYTMCAPKEAVEGVVHEYELTIVTKREGQAEKETVIPIDLKDDSGDFTGSPAGKQFEISLKFKKSRAVAVVASIDEWKTGGQGNADITD